MTFLPFAILQVLPEEAGSPSRATMFPYREGLLLLAEETIFAKIARGEIDADIVYEDELCVAFRDISPQAPTHVLVIPRQVVTSLSDPKATPELLGHLSNVCAKVADEQGLTEDGYRVVTNIGANGGQTVEHLHFHVLGGRALGWPPG